MKQPDLPRAHILEVSGWGKATQTRGAYRVHFLNDGPGVVQIQHYDSGTMAYQFDPVELQLSFRNVDVQTGGGFIGGGFGLEGEAIGIAEAQLLNALTSQNKHYGMLVFNLRKPGLSVRRVVLGYRSLPDVEISKRLAAVISSFMDHWTDEFLKRLHRAADDISTLEAAVERMAKRGWFNQAQLVRTQSALHPVPRDVRVSLAQSIVEFGLSEESHLSHLSHRDSPASGETPGQMTTVEQLRELGELHASGVLTDEEFIAAKAELLR